MVKFNEANGVADRDRRPLHKGYGMVNVEFGILKDNHNRFQIGSITKTFYCYSYIKTVNRME